MPLPKSKTRPKASRHSFTAIGTTWTVEFFEPVTAPDALLAGIQRRIAAFDKTYSRFRSDSWLSRIGQQPGKHTLPADAQPLFDVYRQLYELSNGLVTPLIGSLLSAAGYDAEYSLRAKKLQPPPTWQQALVYDFPFMTTTRPVQLDVGAAGKGYAVDIVAELVRQAGVSHFWIDAGGDMVYEGPNPLRIALEHPTDPSLAVGVANLQNHALCGSAGNRRAWGKFHHIMDPQTLQSPRHVQAVWVVADSALVADGLATALFFVPASRLQTRYTFEYSLVHANGSLEKSADFPATFFTTKRQR